MANEDPRVPQIIYILDMVGMEMEDPLEGTLFDFWLSKLLAAVDCATQLWVRLIV